jgi:hypothetical protein
LGELFTGANQVLGVMESLGGGRRNMRNDVKNKNFVENFHSKETFFYPSYDHGYNVLCF